MWPCRSLRPEEHPKRDSIIMLPSFCIGSMRLAPCQGKTLCSHALLQAGFVQGNIWDTSLLQYTCWAELGYRHTGESWISELGLHFSVKWMLVRHVAPQKEEITISACFKQDWETPSRPLNELWVWQSVLQAHLCLCPSSTPWVATTIASIFKKLHYFSNNTFWINDRPSVNNQLPSLQVQLICC